MPRKAKQTNETEKEAFPTVLRELIAEKSLTQGSVAEGIGMTRQVVSLYTTGQSTPDINTLSKMADYFGVSCDYLLGRTDIKSPDITIKEMHKKTGLSEYAIFSLINNNKNSGGSVDRLRFINDLLEDVESLYFLSGAYSDLKRHEQLVSEIEKIEHDNPIVLEQKDTEDYKLFRCQKLFMCFVSRGVATNAKKET